MKIKFVFCFSLLFTVFTYGQVGINNHLPLTTFDIKATNPRGDSKNVDGLLIPRVDRQRAQSMTLKDIPISTVIYIDDITTGTQDNLAMNIDTVGFYYFDGAVWIKNDRDTSLISNSDGTFTYVTEKKNSIVIDAVMPKFFYFPSIVIPVEDTDPSYDSINKEFNLDLYKIYLTQFSTPVMNSNPLSKIPTLLNTALDYFVTYCDSSVFDLISLSTNGVLKYKLKAGYAISEKTFMNIVLKVK